MSHLNFTQRILVFASILLFGVFVFVAYLIAYNKTSMLANSTSVSDSGTNSFVLENNQIIKANIDLNAAINIDKRTSFEIPQTAYVVTNNVNLDWSYQTNTLSVKSGNLYIYTLRQINIKINDLEVVTILPDSKVLVDSVNNRILVISGVAINNTLSANSFQTIKWLVDEFVVEETTLSAIENDSEFMPIIYTAYDFDLLPSELKDLSPSKFIK